MQTAVTTMAFALMYNGMDLDTCKGQLLYAGEQWGIRHLNRDNGIRGHATGAATCSFRQPSRAPPRKQTHI
jgi:hypothetical protein